MAGKCCAAKWRTQAWQAVLSSNESGTSTWSSGDLSVNFKLTLIELHQLVLLGRDQCQMKGVPGAARARLHVNDP